MKKYFLLFAFGTLIALTACQNSDNKNNPGNNDKTNPVRRIDWGSIPSTYNPRIDDIQIRTDGVEKINMDLFGFRDDVEVVYLTADQPNIGILRMFKVYKDSASWGDVQARPNGKNLDLKNYGSYSCSIQTENGQIKSLKGGCYIRLQVFLPVGSQIEVYNAGQLITKRFIPIDAATFLNDFDRATWAADKFVVIENYLASYSGMAKSPTLLAKEVGKVVSGFHQKADKIKALGRLHRAITDRENLAKMIDDEFTYFDREEARRTVGL